MALNENANEFQSAAGSNTTRSGAKTTGKGFLDLALGNVAPVSKNNSGEALNTVTKHFREMLAEQATNFNLQVLPIDTTVSGLIAPAIAVVQVKDKVAAIFTILIEHGVPKLSPRTYKIQDGEDAVIPTTMGDVYNVTESFYNKVKDVVSKSVTANEYVEAGQSVLPEECSVNDEEALRRILHRASCATHTLLHADSTGVSLANLGDDELIAHLDFTQTQVYTGAGLPIRKSFSVELYASARNQTNSNDLAVQTRTDITNCVGYVDLTHVGQVPVPGPNGMQMLSNQSLLPHIHLTSTEVESGVTTPELQYLSLSSAGLLLRNYTYEQALRQKFSTDGQVDIHSLNGLSLEIDAEVGANQANFDLRAFMAEFVHAAPVFTLDVPECDDLSWAWSDLRLAAMGDQQAYNRVWNACNALTDGVFEHEFPHGEPMASIINDRVILGYFKNSDGERVDLRQLDYLAALNLLGESDRDAAFAYGDTFNVNKGPLEQRLSDRLKIMDEITNGTKKVTGYAVPVLLYGSFLVALSNAVEKAAGGIRVDNPTNTTRTISRNQQEMLSYAADPSRVNQMTYGTQATTSRLTPNMRGGRYHR